ncbi:MAG: putative 3-methyladenine DNA glycosylase [Chlamydiae bacterium]|nr:putative 3-methyladenine DNA glycosylase [Chlamydiota bacterium]
MLSSNFFENEDVCSIAKALLGKCLCTYFIHKTIGIITEVEAYSFKEKACHAYQNKQTKRNSMMFEKGGTAYVYLCYGMHPLFNIVTNKKDVAEAILVRRIEPLEGIDIMKKRRNGKDIGSGPGKLTQSLGIELKHNGLKLNTAPIWIEDRGFQINKNVLYLSKRIGIDYAGDDKDLLWRYSIKNTRGMKV